MHRFLSPPKLQRYTHRHSRALSQYLFSRKNLLVRHGEIRRRGAGGCAKIAIKAATSSGARVFGRSSSSDCGGLSQRGASGISSATLAFYISAGLSLRRHRPDERALLFFRRRWEGGERGRSSVHLRACSAGCCELLLMTDRRENYSSVIQERRVAFLGVMRCKVRGCWDCCKFKKKKM